MGILSRLADRLDRAAGTPPVHLASPWGTSPRTTIGADLVRELWPDADAGPIDRAAAMRVPAIARGRHLLVATIAAMPLRALRGAETPDQPRWLTRTDGPQSPGQRLAWTVDDLVFHGVSAWAVERDFEGRVTAAGRIPFARWHIDDDGAVRVDDQPVSDDSVLLIPGLHEGILSFGATTIRAAAQMERAILQRVAVPMALVELHQATDDQLTDDEVDGLIDAYVRARQRADGAVMYTPAEVEVRVHGETPVGDAAIQARNAAAIDCARIMGIPGALIDASNVNSSLTYETTSGRGSEFAAYSLSLYTGAIEARLSQDDVVPRGWRIRLDQSASTGPIPTTGLPVDD